MDLENVLVSNGLEAYLPMFRLHNIRGDIAGQLAAEDSLEVGVESLGHRIRILKLIDDCINADEQHLGSSKRSDSTRSRPPYKRAVFSTPALQRGIHTNGSSVVNSPPNLSSSPTSASTKHSYHPSSPPQSVQANFGGKTRSFSVPDGAKHPTTKPVAAQGSAASILQENAMSKQRIESNERQMKRLNETVAKLRADSFRKFKEIEPLPNPLERHEHSHHHHLDPRSSLSPTGPYNTSTGNSFYGSSGISGSNSNINAIVTKGATSVTTPGGASSGSLTPSTPTSHRMSLPASPSHHSSSTASSATKPHISHQGSSSTLSTSKQDQPSKRSSFYESKRSPQDSYFTRIPPGSGSAMASNGSLQSPNLIRSSSVRHAPGIHTGPPSGSAPSSASTPHGTVPPTLSNVSSPPYSENFSTSNPNLMIQNSNVSTHGEPYKKLRCGESDDAARVLSSMFRRYHSEGDLSQWRLQIMYGDKSRDSLDHEFPLVIFKQSQEQGHKPMFHAKKIQPPKSPQGSYI